jgi:hypothetical protein
LVNGAPKARGNPVENRMKTKENPCKTCDFNGIEGENKMRSSLEKQNLHRL